jgi:hypothetical protein
MAAPPASDRFFEPFDFLKLSQKKAMEVSLKTENEERTEKIIQTRGSEGGRRGFTGTCQRRFRWRVTR